VTEKSKNQTNSNGRGGKRPGSGRPPGAATKKTRAIAEAAMAEGITPLEYMLELMRTEIPDDLEGQARVHAAGLRFEAAKAAAPYIHPRLAAVEHTGADGKDLIPSAPVFQINLSKE
jgi:hypothetical protein